MLYVADDNQIFKKLVREREQESVRGVSGLMKILGFPQTGLGDSHSSL